MSRLGNYESGGAGLENSLTVRSPSPSWGFTALETGDGTDETVGSDVGSTAVQGSGDDSDSGYRGGSPARRNEGWTTGDTDWQTDDENLSGSTIQLGSTEIQHLEDAENDPVDEVHLNASSSENAETSAGSF